MPSHSQRPRDKRLVVGVTGRIGSGKTTVSKYLESKHEFQYLRYSAVLAEWQAQEPDGKVQLQQVGWDVMAGGAQAELNRRLIERIEPDANVVVDGLRHKLDHESLRACFPSWFALLYLETEATERFVRLNKLGRYADLSSFDAADAHPVEQHIESLRAAATFVIQNDRTIDDLFAAIRELFFVCEKEGPS